ncbi:MAG TPA: hypothetical protein VF046_11460 [Gemmatimonadales bacterium]
MVILRRLHRMGTIGLAIGPSHVVAMIPAGSRQGQGSVWIRELSKAYGEDGFGRELAAALKELRERLGSTSGRLVISMLPPLVRLRRLELPRARPDDIRRAVTGLAGRYFLDVPGPQAVALAAAQGPRRSPVVYLAAAAEEALIDEVFAAAAAAGWRLDSVTPAHFAWRKAVCERWPPLRKGRAALLVPQEAWIEALVLEDGLLQAPRRFRRGSDPAWVLEELGTTRIALVEFDDRGTELARTLTEAGAEALGLSSAAAAAEYAAGCGGPALLPERVRRLRDLRAARLARRLYLAAAALLVLAAGLELWGARRELDAVEARRTAHRAQVLKAMELREGIEQVEARVASLARAEAEVSRWSPALADVAQRLPRDAYLLSLSGTADTLRLEGLAGRAAGVFDAVRRVPGIKGVRADAPIRQEARDSATPVEHFLLAARLGGPAPGHR